jgi:hypothetical protein
MARRAMSRGALGVALVWAFVIEGVLPDLFREPELVRWLPGSAAQAVLHGASATATTLSAGAAVAVLVGYAGALAVGGAAVTAGREVGAATG